MFTDALIRRQDLPRDVFQFIRACAYDHEVPKDYRKDAQKILKADYDLANAPRTPIKRTRVGRSDKAKERDQIEKQLDDCARKICFARDHDTCIKCGLGPPHVLIQWAHVKTRGVISLRWDSANNMTLCAGDHLWWHQHPSESGPWFKETFPERWEYIQRALRNKATIDRKLLLICLKAEVEAL